MGEDTFLESAVTLMRMGPMQPERYAEVVKEINKYEQLALDNSKLKLAQDWVM